MVKLTSFDYRKLLSEVIFYEMFQHNTYDRIIELRSVILNRVKKCMFTPWLKVIPIHLNKTKSCTGSGGEGETFYVYIWDPSERLWFWYDKDIDEGQERNGRLTFIFEVLRSWQTTVNESIPSTIKVRAPFSKDIWKTSDLGITLDSIVDDPRSTKYKIN